MTAAQSACSGCGREVCTECGSWLALRFRCLDCAASYRRWQRVRSRIARVALALPLMAMLFSVGALMVTRPTPQYLPFLERDVPTATVSLSEPAGQRACFRYKGCD